MKLKGNVSYSEGILVNVQMASRFRIPSQTLVRDATVAPSLHASASVPALGEGACLALLWLVLSPSLSPSLPVSSV